MRWKPRPTTLRARLLGLLLPVVAVVLAVSLWNTRADALRAADAAFDRSLLGAIKGLDQNVSTASGGLSVEQPWRLFEFFQLAAGGTVHYRVATDDGLVEIGAPGLPPPPGPLTDGQPRFYDATHFGEPVRVGALRRPPEPPLGEARHVLIQVAEGTASREAFATAFVRQALWRDALLLGALVLIVGAALAWTLHPVQALARATRERDPEDLGPLRDDGLPRDLQPLVAAINAQLERNAGLLAQRRQFLDDASHQLRTPLTTLRAQLDYARREADPARVRQALDALSQELEHASRATNQLLALARADAEGGEGLPAHEPVDLGALVREVALGLLPLARRQGCDFGVDLPEDLPPVPGDRVMLREALSNLAHNALVHGAAGGEGAAHVTLWARVADGTWALGAEDDGPGLEPALRERLGERFAKGRGSRGAGLGLAMVHTVARRHGATLRAAVPASGRGARVWLEGPVT